MKKLLFISMVAMVANGAQALEVLTPEQTEFEKQFQMYQKFYPKKSDETYSEYAKRIEIRIQKANEWLKEPLCKRNKKVLCPEEIEQAQAILRAMKRDDSTSRIEELEERIEELESRNQEIEKHMRSLQEMTK